VLNGESPFALHFDNRSTSSKDLGVLAPNAAIRRVLFETVRDQENCTIITERAVISVDPQSDHVDVLASSDKHFKARLAVAADTRFSALRQSQGISARMTDFGRSMMVCRMTHTTPHEHVATEWFGRGQTIAMLPLQEGMSSFVLTLPSKEIDALLELDPEAFAAEAQRRTQGRWGAMALASTRHAYPLVAVYADRFVAPRFALAGDAAVGMHPVTAHGFNLGLAGAMTLAEEIQHSAKRAGDIGAAAGLLRYQRTHRRATWPMFAATNAIAKLYSDDRFLARIARPTGLRLMRAASPIRRAIEARLSA
jgi:ubiquinone biosynthesis UbiH/UbiF/VisC/COQ6 family hydroxylase